MVARLCFDGAIEATGVCTSAAASREGLLFVYIIVVHSLYVAYVGLTIYMIFDIFHACAPEIRTKQAGAPTSRGFSGRSIECYQSTR